MHIWHLLAVIGTRLAARELNLPMWIARLRRNKYGLKKSYALPGRCLVSFLLSWWKYIGLVQIAMKLPIFWITNKNNNSRLEMITFKNEKCM